MYIYIYIYIHDALSAPPRIIALAADNEAEIARRAPLVGRHAARLYVCWAKVAPRRKTCSIHMQLLFVERAPSLWE